MLRRPAAGDRSRDCYHLSRSALPTFFKQNTTAEASRGRILPGPRKAGLRWPRLAALALFHIVALEKHDREPRIRSCAF